MKNKIIKTKIGVVCLIEGKKKRGKEEAEKQKREPGQEF